MSILIDAITRGATFNNSWPINPLTVAAILLLFALLGWKEKLRIADSEANQARMALLDVVLFPLGCIFVAAIVQRVMIFL